MAELRIEGVGKAFDGQTVLQDVYLTVPSGRLVAILGRSGSGKTTLLRLVCGFERADAGRITIDGQLVSGSTLLVPPEQRRIGYVAQEGALFPHLSVADNIVFGLPRAARRRHHRVGALLELVGLPPSYAMRWPHELSGGEQQRIALARALAPKPRLVLLDEPFSSLDAALRIETRDAVAAALSAAGATALLVTHDQSEALSLGDQVAVLRDGRLVQMARPELLYRRPLDAALARFVGEAVVRPEQIRLLPPAEVPDLWATVGHVTFYGHDASVALVLADGPALTARVAGHLSPRQGAAVGLRVEGDVVAFRRDVSVTAA